MLDGYTSECYYSWCRHHDKKLPTCRENRCIQPPAVLAEFKLMRYQQVLASRKPPDGRQTPAGDKA
jgi:hypothetical protein